MVKTTRPRVVAKKIRRAVTIRMTISRWHVGDNDKRQFRGNQMAPKGSGWIEL